MTETNFKCDICNKPVEFTKLPIYCDGCYEWFHGKCEKISVEKWKKTWK